MIDQGSSKKLVEGGGYGIIEHNDKLYFVNYGTYQIFLSNFIMTLLFVIFVVNGAVQLFINLSAGIILIFLSSLFFLALLKGIESLKKVKQKTLEELDVMAVIDFGKSEFFDKKSQVSVPLNSVNFKYKMQIASSSRAIYAEWLDGSMLLSKGNPFTGGSVAFMDALKDKGLVK